MLQDGYTVDDYVKALGLYQSESGTGKKRRTIAKYQEEFGISYSEARALYSIFG